MRSRSTTRRPNAGEVFGQVMFTDGYVLGGAAKPPHGLRRRAAADVRRPARLLAAPPGELHQRLLPGGRRGGRRLRLVPVPADRPGGTLFGGELTRRQFRNRPEVEDFLDQFSARTCSARWAACAASSRISPNVNVGPDCYAERHPRRRVVILTDGADGGNRTVRRLRPDAGRGRAGSFWTGMVEYMQEGPDSPRRESSTTSRRAGRRSQDRRRDERGAADIGRSRGTERGSDPPRQRVRRLAPLRRRPRCGACSCSSIASRRRRSRARRWAVRLPPRRATPTGSSWSASRSSSASAASSSSSGR